MEECDRVSELLNLVQLFIVTIICSGIKRAVACLMALLIPSLLYVYPARTCCKEADNVFLWKGQKVCTVFNCKINSVTISWETLYAVCNFFFQLVVGKCYLGPCLNILHHIDGVSTEWRREGGSPPERWSPEVAEREMLCLCPGLVLHTTSDSCAAVLRKRWRKLPHSLIHLWGFFCFSFFFLIAGKLSCEAGQRYGFVVSSSSWIFEECSKCYSQVFADV